MGMRTGDEGQERRLTDDGRQSRQKESQGEDPPHARLGVVRIIRVRGAAAIGLRVGVVRQVMSVGRKGTCIVHVVEGRRTVRHGATRALGHGLEGHGRGRRTDERMSGAKIQQTREAG